MNDVTVRQLHNHSDEAIANGLPLHTCNPADFADIDGLEVVAVPHPG